MDGGSFSAVANGNIAPSRFVKRDSTATGRVVQCSAATDPIFAISQPQVHNIALSGGGFSQTDDGFAAVAGEMLNLIGPGDDEALLELGGTVAHGDYLTSDGSGKGIATVTDKNRVGAQALASGTSGQLIRVKPMRFDLSV